MPAKSEKTRTVGEKGRFHFVNWPLLLVVIGLVVYGLVVVYFVTSGTTGTFSMAKRQLTGVLVGLPIFIALWWLDYRKLIDAYIPLLILAAVFILLPKVPGLGVEVNGAALWVNLFGFRFQPAEPAKLLVIFAFAGFFAKYKGRITGWKDFLKVIGFSLIPFVLVLLQPDLGTALVFLVVAAGMLLVAGLDYRYFIGTVLVLVTFIAGVLILDPILDEKMGRDVLVKDYQMNRLLVFVDEERDPQGEGYNLRQAKIAIGSGELKGKGLGKGTQGKLHFLPEAETDFIFAILGEELGFFGAMLLLALYLALLVIALDIAFRSGDLFGTLIAAGIIAMWTFQVFENIGMNLGILPITGIPLPFISFGSSFMVTNLGAVGMLLSVWTRRGKARMRA